MAWYQALRGSHVFLRLPINNKFCANGHSYKCGFGTCKLDGSSRNLAECSGKCLKFKPSLGERIKMAWTILRWKNFVGG